MLQFAIDNKFEFVAHSSQYKLVRWTSISGSIRDNCQTWNSRGDAHKLCFTNCVHCLAWYFVGQKQISVVPWATYIIDIIVMCMVFSIHALIPHLLFVVTKAFHQKQMWLRSKRTHDETWNTISVRNRVGKLTILHMANPFNVLAIICEKAYRSIFKTDAPWFTKIRHQAEIDGLKTWSQ